MEKLIIELTDSQSLKALQELESRQLIRILKKPDLNALALAGEPITEEDFKNWVRYAEESPMVSIQEARQKWAAQKEKLRKSIR